MFHFVRPLFSPSRLVLVLLALFTTGCDGSSSVFRRLYFSNSPATTATAGSTYTYHASVSASSSSVTWTLLTAPDEVSVSPGGLVSWSTSDADIGTHELELRAKEGSKTGTIRWTLHVVAALAPSASEDGVDHAAQLGRTGGSPLGRISTRTSNTVPDEEMKATVSVPPSATIQRSNWRDSLESSGEIPAAARLAAERAKEAGLELSYGFTWTAGEDLPLPSRGAWFTASLWSDEETRADFLDMIRTFVERYQPHSLWLCDPMDAYRAKMQQPQAWADWLDLAREARWLVETVNPNILVH